MNEIRSPLESKSTKVKNNLENLLNNTLQSYYWIGMIITDGHIDTKNKRLFLSLQEKDKDHIYEFAKFINQEKINYIPAKIFNFSGKINKKIKTQAQYKVCVQDKYTIPKIEEKFQIVNKKTYNPISIDVVNSMSKDQFVAFFIGCISGDGSISKNGSNNSYLIELTAHKNWKFIFDRYIQIIKSFGFKCQKLTFKKDQIRLRITNGDFFLFLKKFIEENFLVVLPRKWCYFNPIETPYRKCANREKIIIPLLKSGKTVIEISKITSEKYINIIYIKKKYNI